MQQEIYESLIQAGKRALFHSDVALTPEFWKVAMLCPDALLLPFNNSNSLVHASRNDYAIRLAQVFTKITSDNSPSLIKDAWSGNNKDVFHVCMEMEQSILATILKNKYLNQGMMRDGNSILPFVQMDGRMKYEHATNFVIRSGNLPISISENSESIENCRDFFNAIGYSTIVDDLENRDRGALKLLKSISNHLNKMLIKHNEIYPEIKNILIWSSDDLVNQFSTASEHNYQQWKDYVMLLKSVNSIPRVYWSENIKNKFLNDADEIGSAIARNDAALKKERNIRFSLLDNENHNEDSIKKIGM